MGCRKHSPGNPCCGCSHECGVYNFPPPGAEYPMTLTITGNHPIVLSGNLVFDATVPPDCIASACVTFEPSNVWTKVFKVKKACTDQFHYEQQKLCCPLTGAATLEPWLDYDISIVAATAATYRASIKYTQLCLKFKPSKYRNDYPTCTATPECGGIRVEACLYLKTYLEGNPSTVMQMEVQGTAVTLPCFDPEDIETVDVLFDRSEDGCKVEPSPGVGTAPGYPSTPAELSDEAWDILPECTVSRSYFLVSEFTVLDSLTFAPSPYIEFAYGDPVPTLDSNCNSNVVEPCVDSQCAEASYFEACTETEQTETACTKEFLCNGVTTTYDGFYRNVGYYGCGIDLDLLGYVNCGGQILNAINGASNESGFGDGPCSLGVITGRTTSCSGETLDNIADGDAIFDPYADPWYLSITI